jgi:ribulose-phosphate 3-epimerase
MISNPQDYLDTYLEAGCDCITIHIEAVPDPTELLTKIRSTNRVAGLSLNPGTNLEAIEPFLSLCDLVLVMSVEPGFGGQAFKPEAVRRISRLREIASPETIISVDGGIGPETIGDCSAAGANLFVAGSAIFNTDNYSEAIAQMRSLAEDCRISESSQE